MKKVLLVLAVFIGLVSCEKLNVADLFRHAKTKNVSVDFTLCDRDNIQIILTGEQGQGTYVYTGTGADTQTLKLPDCGTYSVNFKMVNGYVGCLNILDLNDGKRLTLPVDSDAPLSGETLQNKYVPYRNCR